MNIEPKKILEQLTKYAAKLNRYRLVCFIVFLAFIYGFLIYRINTLSSQQPSDNDVAAQLEGTSTPRIDESVVNKIKQLQDNSVQVKTLFSEARKNPFSE